MSINIECGKTYATRDGGFVTIVNDFKSVGGNYDGLYPASQYRFHGNNDSFYYENGKAFCDLDSPSDIVGGPVMSVTTPTTLTVTAPVAALTSLNTNTFYDVSKLYAATGVNPNSKETYPIRYVLTDADNLAARAEQFLHALEALRIAEDIEEGTDAIHQCEEDVKDLRNSLELAIYEYRKRAKRYRDSTEKS